MYKKKKIQKFCYIVTPIFERNRFEFDFQPDLNEEYTYSPKSKQILFSGVELHNSIKKMLNPNDFVDDENQYPEDLEQINRIKFAGGEAIEIEEIKEKLKISM